MTIEERILISFDDIAALVFECPNCHARVTRNPDHPGTLPAMCGQCQNKFIGNITHGESLIDHLVNAIMAYRQGASNGVIMKLEINGKDLRGQK